MAVQSTILIVDDDERGYELLEAALQAIGAHVIFTQSGQDAIQLAHAHPPVMILMDLLLPAPSIKGWDAIHVLKNDPATAAIPILAFTAAGGEGIMRAMKAGADGFIEKPFGIAQLQRVAMKYLGALQH